MPRNKNGGSRGKGRGRGGGLRNKSAPDSDDYELDFVPFSQFKLPNPSTKYGGHGGENSLQREALNTPSRHTWGSDQKLRNSKMQFISAGAFEPSENLDPEAPSTLAFMSLDDPSGGSTVPTSEPEPQDTPVDTEDEVSPTFVIDTQGTPFVNTGRPSPILRSISPTPSDSSDEIILFTGRDSSGRAMRRLTPVKTKVHLYDIKIQTIDDKSHARPDSSASVLLRTTENNADMDIVSQLDVDTSHIFSSDATNLQGDGGQGGSHKISKRTKRFRRTHQQAADKQDLMDDYIANMEEDAGPDAMYNQRDLGGHDSDIWQETDESSGKPVDHNNRTDWAQSDLCDFDDLSTSEELGTCIQVILSKRERLHGTQYLIVWDNQSADEARWISHENLSDLNAQDLIRDFEAEEKLIAELNNQSTDESDGSDDDMVDMDGSASDNEEDEADLVQKKIDRMTDEKIAILLSKQEELGMGSAKILLFDDSDVGLQSPKGFKTSNTNKSKPLLPAPSRSRGEFPPAAAFADAYDGFDIMDFERPSLKKKPKGRKGRLAFDISDSELEGSMQMAWDNDRSKKKERKEEREKSRAAGLLGKKKGFHPDMKAKYREGMDINAVKEELKAFILSGNTSLTLPPMDKADRKTIHELANAFNLKSKSAGQGNKRFPVLYRTSRTSFYSESAFIAVEARLAKRFLPRMDVKGKRPAKVAQSGRGGLTSSAVSYRDGDVVGASAPELGVENKGRAMLEKMGWSSGTALGALNNKGILQPVSHVVKTTKAGLG